MTLHLVPDPAPAFLLGHERFADGRVFSHAVPLRDRTNSALCGARVKVRRAGFDTAAFPAGTCRACARLASAVSVAVPFQRSRRSVDVRARTSA
ncbi:MAG TPA: hypothetical protein VGD72_14880 [Mycobacteriales bacterium]|jgi:uncharacterized protein (DUF934 family)